MCPSLTCPQDSDALCSVAAQGVPQGQGSSWDAARVTVTVPGCSTVQDATQDNVPQQTAGRSMSQPQQEEVGRKSRAQPCTALLHVRKLRHRQGCAKC